MAKKYQDGQYGQLVKKNQKNKKKKSGDIAQAMSQTASQVRKASKRAVSQGKGTPTYRNNTNSSQIQTSKYQDGQYGQFIKNSRLGQSGAAQRNNNQKQQQEARRKQQKNNRAASTYGELNERANERNQQRAKQQSKSAHRFEDATKGTLQQTLGSHATTFYAARNPNEDKYIQSEERRKQQGEKNHSKFSEGQYGQLVKKERSGNVKEREKNLKKASELIEKGNKNVEKAKEGLGKGGRFAVDTYSAMLGMATDAAAGPFSMGSMASRSFGGAYDTAKKEGASDSQATLYGASQAAVEVGTEKMFSVAKPLKKLYGGGAGDDVAEKLLEKMTKKAATKTGKEVVYHSGKATMAALSEGLEEMVSEGLEPALANQIYANATGTPHSTSAKDILYAGAVGGAMGGILGGGGQAMEYNQGRKVQNVYGNDGLKTMAKKLRDVADEESGRGAVGEIVNRAVDAGEEVTSMQARRLYQAAAQQEEADFQRQNVMETVANNDIAKKNYLNPVSRDEQGNMLVGEVTRRRYDEAAQKVENQVNESGIAKGLEMPEHQVQQIASAVSAIKTGVAGTNEVNMFLVANPKARTVYETITGEKLPAGNTDTKETLYARIAANRVESAKLETEAFTDRVKGGMAQDVAKAYEPSGQAAFEQMMDQADIANAVQTQNDITAFDDYYRAGRNGIAYETVAQMNHPAHQAVKAEVRKAAWEAGASDAVLAADTAKGVQMEIGKKISQSRSKGKSGAHRGKVISELSQEAKRNLPASQQRMFRQLARVFNVNIHIVDEAGFNGKYEDGEVYLSVQGDRDLPYIFSHEITHHMQDFAPVEYNELKELVRQAWAEKGGIDEAVNDKIAQYAEKDVQLTYEDALDEIIADSTYEMIQDEGFAEQMCSENRSLAQKILDAIKNVLSKLRQALAEGDGFTPAQNADLLSQLDILKDAEKLWTDGLVKAAENRDAVGAKGSTKSRVIKLSAKKGKKDSIRTQIESNLKKINEMDAVADVKTKGYKGKSDKQIIDAVMLNYKKRGYGVDRKGFGFISLEEEFINRSLNYLNAEAEYAAFDALPQVLKNGMEIRDNEHKGRGYNTVTFAAPVVINGKRGIVGAVVAKTKGNRYKTHRILMPDGSQYIFENEKAEATTSGMTEEKINGEGPDITSAVDNSISQTSKKDNGKSYSFKGIDDENVKYSIREDDPPRKTVKGYKVFVVKNGKLYPPMVANPGGADTPVGVWLDADEGVRAGESKTGRPQVKAGGKGTQGGSGKLAYRPGWHLGEAPMATQFARLNKETGEKELFPENFVWAECEVAADHDYQDEAMSYGYSENGKFRHAYAGLPRIPKDGMYRYRTNPDPSTVPWIISGSMKVTKILSDAEVDEILRSNATVSETAPEDKSKLWVDSSDGDTLKYWYGGKKEWRKAPVVRKGGKKTLEELGISNEAEIGVTRFSLKDSDGRELSEGQQRYFKDSKIRGKDGSLLTLYHQTGNDFTVFDTRHEGAGSGDWGTPYGIFMKSSPKDIGLGGGIQMELYANIANPLKVRNRSELDQVLKSDKDYSKLREEYDQINANYKEKFNDAKKALVDFITKWRKDNPDAGGSDIYNDPDFNKVYEAEDAVVEEWTEKADEISAKCKESINAYLESNGYDGIILDEDKGSFGRSTKAYIALYPEQVKSTNNPQPTRNHDVRFSFAGESALNADNKMLQKAKEMYDDFESSEDIRKETGWHRGADGKWRFEIDDSQMKVFTDGDALFRKAHPEYVRLQDLYEKFWKGDISDAEQKELTDLNEIWGSEKARLHTRLLRGNAHLADIIQHDVLFKNYPQLAEVTVKIGELDGLNGANGAYVVNGSEIRIDEDLFKDEYRTAKRDGTLVHEIQHAIQDIEEFAKGANLDTLSVATDRTKAKATAASYRYEAASDNLLDALEEAGYFDKYGDDIDIASEDELARIKNEYEDSDPEIEKLVGEFEKQQKQYDEANGKSRELRNMSTKDFYKYAAGEVEARDSASRLKYDSEERRANRPDIDSPSVLVEDYIRYSFPDEESIMDYAADHETEFVDVPPVRDYERKARSAKMQTVGELRAQVDKLKADKKLTRGRILNKKSVKEQVNDMVVMLKSYGTVDGKKTDTKLVNQATDNIASIYRYIKEGDYPGAVNQAYNAAQDMVDNLHLVDDSMFREYEELRDLMRTTKISISEEDAANIPDFREWKKSQFGRLRIGNDGMDVDTFYQVLTEKYPELFDSSISHPADQLQAMADVRESMEPFDILLDSEERSDIVEQAAHDMIDIAATGTPWKSWADRKKETYDEQVKRLKQRQKEALRDAVNTQKERSEKKLRQERQKWKERQQKEAEKHKEKLAAEKEKHKSKEQKQKYNRERKEIKEKIGKTHKWLSDRLLKPTDDKHIPEDFRKQVASILVSLDMQTERSKDLELKYGVSKATMKLHALKARYEEIAKEDGTGIFAYDDTLVSDMDSLGNLVEGKSVDQLTNEELSGLHDILKSIQYQIGSYNKWMSGYRNSGIFETANKSINACRKRQEKIKNRGKKYADGKFYERTGLVGLDQSIDYAMMTPGDAFQYFGEGMNEAYGALREGFNKHIENIQTIRNFFDEVFSPYFKKTRLRKRAKPGSEIEDWRNSSTVKEFKVSGGTIQLNTSQIMSLYCLSKRDQAMGHILNSGIVATRVDPVGRIGRKLGKGVSKAIGGKSSVQGSAITVTFDDVEMIKRSLSDGQVEICEKILQFMNETCSVWGNEVSMKLFDYNKFTEPNYFPIKSSDAYIDTKTDGTQQMQSVTSYGFTKGTVVNASNPIVVDDIFNVAADHMNQMSLYNAFAPAMHDFNKIYNYRVVGEGGKHEASVKAALKDAYGFRAGNYIDRFLKDVNNQASNSLDGLTKIVTASLANYKKSTIAANLRVALQQPTAVARAFIMINPKYFLGGKNSQLPTDEKFFKNMKDMQEHCPIARWKSWGFSQVDMARGIDDIMMNNEWTRLDRFTMEIYGKLDDITWGQIWGAVRKETLDKHPDVKVNSEEFYRICSERASEIYDKTQVVDSVFHRSQIMRNTDTMSKMVSSFMAEPTRTYNMMRTEILTSIDMIKNGESGGQAKLTRAVTVFLFNAALCSAAAAVADAYRRRDPDWDDDDDGSDWSWFEYWQQNAWANFKDNANPLNMIPVLKDFVSYSDGWDAQNMAMQGWAQLFDSFNRLREDDDDTAFSDFTNALGMVTGIPVKNVKREGKMWFEILGIDVSAAEIDGEETTNGEVLLNKAKAFFKKRKSKKDKKKSDDKDLEPVDYAERVADGKEAGKGLSGEEKEDEVWSAVTKNYTNYIKAGDTESLKTMRKAYEAVGGDMDRFDDAMLKKTKEYLKKNIGEGGDAKKLAKYREYLIKEYSYTEAKISNEIIAKSETAKKFQVSLCEADEDTAVNTLSQLIDAGVSYEDFVQLYENRYKAIKPGDYSTGEMVNPVSGQITSGFGYRNSPGGIGSTNHKGIDIAVPLNSDVAAADGGKVVGASWRGGYGYMVVIDHGNGRRTQYAHLNGYYVQKGDSVSKGQIIAKSGSTGNSTGPHLHFEVRENGTPVNPMNYLK